MRTAIRPVRQDVFAVVLIASDEDWRQLRDVFPDMHPGSALGHEWTSRAFGNKRVVFVNTGSDSVSAAATAQHAADQWRPAAFFVPGTAQDSALLAFAWVAERNRIPLYDHSSVRSVLDELGGISAASEPDAVTPLPNSGTE
jgi:hypothetical protein